MIGTEYTGISVLMSHTSPENLTAYNEFPVPVIKSRETVDVEITLPFNKQFLDFPERNGLDLEFYTRPFDSSVETVKKYLKFGQSKKK